MKNILLTTLIVFTISCGSSNKTVLKPSANLTDFQNTITEEGLFIDLNILASDSLEGRDTGSDGERKASEYLASRYNELGLTPIGDNGSYFQNFELSTITYDSIQFEVLIENELVDRSTHSLNKIGNLSRMGGGEVDLEGGIVFIGFGDIDNIVSTLDLSGKWLLSFYDERSSNMSMLQNIVAEHNALGSILIANFDANSFSEEAYILQGDFDSPSKLQLPYLTKNSGTNTRIHPKLAAQILGLDSITQLTEFAADLKANITEFSPYEINASLRYLPSVRIQNLETRNVVALLEGSHPELKNEVIVLSAHYDHIGIGSPDASGDAIYNGADDDGSGTVGLLHAAQAFATARNAGANLNRSILFLHVSGEERGLFGSRYYSDHPIFPIEKTIANLNADMIGRRDKENEDNPDYIYIIGGKIISSGLQAILEEANQQSVSIELSDRYNDLNDPKQFYRRSDHWNFGRLGVPFIFYFNGTHDDYHRPSDEIDKIDFEALRKRTQLIFMTTAILSNTDTPPTVDNQEFILRTQQ